MSITPFSTTFANLLPPYHMGQPASPRQLARYLPDLPVGMFANWPDALPQDDGLIFDPFGLSPDLDIELAHLGRRVLVCVNNPIVRLLLELSAQPPSETELNRCVSILALASKAGQRLEGHIQSLYQTICVSCGKTIQASGYLWERDAELPYAREYTCPFCWNNGTFPITTEDEQVLAPVRRAPLQRAWAIERIAPPGDPLRDDAVEVVDSHLARPMYVIFTLINRLESLDLTDRERLILNCILLSVLDDATPIQQLEHVILKPRQLIVPTKFREHNLWVSFEKSVDLWKNQPRKVRLTIYPEMPDGAGICIFGGRVRDLVDQPPAEEIKRVITAFPRPNQALWTLSAVWAAWLLGRKQAAGMAQVIARRRYDWNWHTSALSSTLKAVKQILSPEVHLVGLIPSVEPAFLTTVFQSMHQAGFGCTGLSIRVEDELAQSTWKLNTPANSTGAGNLAGCVRQTAGEFLQEKGEPAEYLEMTAVACLGIEKYQAWPVEQTQTNLLQQMRAAYSNPTIFRHHGSGEQTLESGMWGLRQMPEESDSLSDRMEEKTVRILANGSPLNLEELENRIRKELKPVFIPIQGYLNHILQSYAEEDNPGSGHWLIRINEHPALRESDIKTIRSLTDTLGIRLGYQTKHHGRMVEWLEPGTEAVRYQFHIITHARISSIVSAPNLYGAIQSIVLPGSRANLLTYKVKQNPLLEEQMAEGWHLVKFRHIYRLAENPMLTTDSLQLWLDSDPPEYQPLQMDLF